MPLYVFECCVCDVQIEVLQRFSDPFPTCSKCETDMKKKPSLTSFSLKGEGWARDNYGITSSKKT